MKVELTIDRTKELPKGAVPALEKELLKRLGNQYENCSLSIRRTCQRKHYWKARNNAFAFLCCFLYLVLKTTQKVR
ncbi:DinI-like family protein [Citrobacter portucalensis]|uniref:DinI-like family protein n=1 Tax=Citrobacter portucalensis TaxID=1639133 RepID=UPI000AFBD398|nr:DinI-like family protein [Citrobacter portucalensis]MDE9709647.1 DinI-like family protein [Citrobacter portucalensis]MDT7469761.1 DinI-like family protein [Citrobacter portucalensis]